MANKVPITVAHGDGIGPEIMAATLHILEAAGARLDIDEIEVGEKVYLKGITAGMEPAAFESIRRTGVFLKAPITTPQGGGYKSLNVTTRKMFGMFANVRPCVSYHPYVRTKHPGMDVVIVRENEEDCYAGIEYWLTDEVVQCLKLITRPGCERIVRYAFEYAVQNNRKKVTCFTKDNIMKMTDGLFHEVYDEISKDYPSIEKEHWIVDIGGAKLADTPEVFDVIVMPNLYGDILSDVAAQIAGSVGLAGSANVGSQASMFEAIHGSAPRRAGQNLANPSGLLMGAVLMLVHVDQPDVAELVHNAWLKTMEDGVHTYDIFKQDTSKEKVGTKEFAQAVAARMGKKPEKLKPATYQSAPEKKSEHQVSRRPAPKTDLMGIDVYIKEPSRNPNALAAQITPLKLPGLKLTMMSNRGQKVWPDYQPETLCVNEFRCRFVDPNGGAVTQNRTIELLSVLSGAGLTLAKTECLWAFDGKLMYSLAQGE